MGISDRSRLSRALGSSAIVKILNLCLGVLTTLVLARILAAENYGVYSFILAVVTLAAVPAQLGVPELVIRETSKFHVLKDWTSLRTLWRWSLRIVPLMCLLTIFILFVGMTTFHLFGDAVDFSILLWATLIMPLAALAGLRGAMLTGIGKVIYGQIPEQIIRPLCLLGMLAIAYLSSTSIDASDALIFYALSGAISTVVGIYFLVRFTPNEVRNAAITPVRFGGAWMKSTLPLALISGIYVFNQQIDIILLGWLGTMEDVGIYKVISQFGLFVIFGQQMVRGVIGTEISRYWTQSNIDGIQQVIRKAVAIVFLTALLSTLVFLFFGKQILSLTAGEDYIVGYKAMLILCFGQLITAAFGPLGSILSMTGFAKKSIPPLLIAMSTNITLNIILIPLYGLEGAAISASVGILIWNFLLWRIVRNEVGVKPTIFGH